MIHKFTQHEFENQLPRNKKTNAPLWSIYKKDSEIVYRIDFNDPDGCFIVVRSSINPLLQIADESGENSIRLFLYDANGTNLISKKAKTKNYITRVRNWEKRLWGQFSYLRKARQLSGNCPVCNKPNIILRIKNNLSMNKNELFARCRDDEHFKQSFRIITNRSEWIL